jgi:hypothetical protein
MAAATTRRTRRRRLAGSAGSESRQLSLPRLGAAATAGLFRADRSDGGGPRCAEFRAFSGLRFDHLRTKPAQFVHSRHQIVDLRRRRAARTGCRLGRGTIVLHHEILSQRVRWRRGRDALRNGSRVCGILPRPTRFAFLHAAIYPDVLERNVNGLGIAAAAPATLGEFRSPRECPTVRIAAERMGGQ